MTRPRHAPATAAARFGTDLVQRGLTDPTDERVVAAVKGNSFVAGEGGCERFEPRDPSVQILRRVPSACALFARHQV